jgi:hypothetical protein
VCIVQLMLMWRARSLEYCSICFFSCWNRKNGSKLVILPDFNLILPRLCTSMGPDRPVSAPVTLRAEMWPTSNESGLSPSSPPPSAPPPQGLLQGRGATQVIWARPQLLSGPISAPNPLGWDHLNSGSKVGPAHMY